MPRDAFRLAFRAAMSAENEDTGEIMLYGEIVQDYGKYYKEAYPEDKSASDFDKAVKELKKNGAKKLKLRINSPGGIVSEAVAMRGILTGAGFESIDIRIEGMCASAATIIASIPGARAIITPGSEYMIHNPWTFTWGNANDLEHEVEHLRQLEATARGFYAQKSGQTDEQIKEWMDNETWFTAEDAVKYGFADEVADEDTGNALPAAACVTSRDMAVMNSLYRAVPKGIAVRQENTPANLSDVSHEAPVAGASTEIHQHEEENPTMEIKDISLDDLRAENPALLEQIQQGAVAAERQRQDDIDALTVPGYEEMAARAKAEGTSAMDFQRQIVAAMKQKGANFLNNRKEETAPAKDVAGGAPTDDKQTEQAEIEANAKEIAAYAKAYAGNDNEGMF